MTVYEEIFEVIKARKAQYDAGNAPEKSYTCYLFDKGVDKGLILKIQYFSVLER